MKEIKMIMSNQFIDLANEHVRNRKDLIKLLLESMTLLTIENAKKLDSSDINNLVLRVDKMNRIFIILKDKMFSFIFPFTIFIDEHERVEIRIPSYSEVIDSRLLSKIKAVFNESLFGTNEVGLTGLYEEFEILLDAIKLEFENLDNDEEINLIWHTIKILLSFEPSYIRYDFDLENFNGQLHPLNHLDINYTDQGSFKIGLNNKLTSKLFIDLLDIKTDCHFLDSVP